MDELIYRQEFETQKLISDYPARLHDRNKKFVFEMSAPSGATHAGNITVSRWKQMWLPDTVKRKKLSPSFELREGYFTYESPEKEFVDWHVNFAHFDLFCAYGGALFAQDEMQVAEHPALASLRHALIDTGYDPITAEDGIATPIVIMGVERRCVVATDAKPDEGRPYGLYGNNFARASEEAIRQATRILNPPTTSNIIAIEAPACGSGRYTREQIEFVLSTAFTGFRAAVYESRRKFSGTSKTTVHTGYWGCGAYGGNRVLMPLLQMIAACCAEVDRLVFHTGGDSVGVSQSVKALAERLPAETNVRVDELIANIEDLGYTWGVSDGN
jgi:Poly (ADP-ribose) glycohydrolase (PARG)